MDFGYLLHKLGIREFTDKQKQGNAHFCLECLTEIKVGEMFCYHCYTGGKG